MRRHSGGDGHWKGWDGIVRELEFLRPMTVSILSERRSVAPPGLLGGKDAKRGQNIWIKSAGGTVNLGGKASVSMGTGDRLRILTPGGGGYGYPKSIHLDTVSKEYLENAQTVENMHTLRQSRQGRSPQQTVRDGGSVNEYARAQQTA